MTITHRKITSRRLSLLFIAALLLSFALLSGCGYTLQMTENLPFDAVAIGIIENKTHEPKLQDLMNRALAEAFSEYGFNVNPNASHRIEGAIIRFDLRPQAEKDLVAVQYEVITEASIILVNTATGKKRVLRSSSPFKTYFSTGGSLESVIAQKELFTYRALKNISQEIVRQIMYEY
jgi:hypothetical protein